MPSGGGGEAALEARGLGLTIGGRRLVRGIDCRFAWRGITAVMGPNGAGKSLLLRLLHGLMEPTEGAVLWNGGPLDAAARRRQAMVFQRPVLLRRSVAANVDFALRLRGRSDRRRRDAILEEANLMEHARRPARQLSGGEQQRLALARALAVEPLTLFLDEPTSSLDPSAVAAFERALEKARDGGAKIVLVTHDAGQARRLADEVVFLHRGSLCEQTAAQRFFTQPESAEAQAYLQGRIVL